jgi:hypothetical protein
MDRAASLKQWRESSAAGTPIVGAGLGTGIFCQVRRSCGSGPHHHLQFWPLPHGWARIVGWLHALRGRERHCRGDGPPSIAHRSQDTGVGVPVDKEIVILDEHTPLCREAIIVKMRVPALGGIAQLLCLARAANVARGR